MKEKVVKKNKEKLIRKKVKKKLLNHGKKCISIHSTNEKGVEK